MALYSYEAYGKDGKKIKGVIDAPSQASVKELLSKQGLYVISVKSTTQEAAGSFWQRWFRGSIKPKDRILFTKQLAVLLKSGIPLLEALELLTEQFTGSLRGIVVSIKDDIKQGTSFADALKKYPKIFDTIYVQLVRAGEASGRLEIILDRLTSYLERREEVSKKIRGALTISYHSISCCYLSSYCIAHCRNSPNARCVYCYGLSTSMGYPFCCRSW